MNASQIRSTVEQLYPAFLRDLEALVNIDSGSENVEGLRRVVDYLIPRLEDMGLSTAVEWHDRYGPFLTARTRGKGKATILFLAHLDTVWPPGTAEERPFRIEEPYAYGPGVNDCRSGMLCQVYTVKVLQELGFQNYGELILVFNPDEELGAPWSGKLITELAREADVALVMEGPTFPDEFIMSRAGTMNYTLEVIGRPIHSGVAPEQGRNAILELVHQLLKIQRLESCDGIKVNLATITGGEKQGIVAGYAKADLDFRIRHWDAVRTIEEKLPQIVEERTIPDTVAKLSGGLGHPPFPEHPMTGELVELVQACGRELGLSLTPKFCGGASDASYAALGGALTLDGLPPWGTLYHTDQEHVDLRTIIPRVALVSSLAMQISQDDKWLRNRE